MTTLRAAAQQALEALEGVVSAHAYASGTPVEAITALRAALAESPMNRKTCEHLVPIDLRCDHCEADEMAVAYMMGAQARRRLTDAEIGEIWFAAKIPGLTETNARLLIRAAERRLAGEK